MYNHILYLLYLLINSAVFYLASAVFPLHVVVGNARFGGPEASVYSGFWVTFLIWTIWDFGFARGIKLHDERVALLFFWATNTVSIWIVARVAHLVGLGISSYAWAIILGGVTVIFHRRAWHIITDPKK